MSDLDEIKARTDVADLIGQYVQLKRAGRNYLALCPFHTERTPSFHIDPARQSWHCFGACSTGGDVFSFIMKKEGCDFVEAKRILAERAGVALESRRDTQEDARRARLFDLNEAAAAFFQASLAAEEGAYATGAAIARSYVGERRIAPEAAELFQLGYAPNSWDALIAHLSSNSFAANDAVTAGLAVESDRGGYDRFRHRLMFPIRDERGRVAGFGGRLLPGDALGAGDTQPKYVNTSQSPIFDKGSIVYGLHLAREAIRSEERAVIVEGYMDVMAAHEHGYSNVVASMGTALTERQIALIKRSASTFVLALDADNAGGEATIRSAYEIINNSLRRKPVASARGIVRQVDAVDIDLRVLSMPEGRDPDDVIRDAPETWPELVQQAKPVLDHLFDVAASQHDLSDPRERSAVVSELTPFIALTADRVMQSHYLQRLARMAQVDEATLRLELRPVVRRRTEAAAAVLTSRPSRDRHEEFCLALLFQYPELRAESAQLLRPDLFGQSENRVLFECWVAWADEGESFDRSLTPDVRPQYERIISTDLPVYDDDALVRALRSTVWSIEQRRLRTEKRAKAAALADIGTADGAAIAERAQTVWESRGDGNTSTAEDEADPAAAFVEDMEAGLKVHRRSLDQREAGRPVRRGGE